MDRAHLVVCNIYAVLYLIASPKMAVPHSVEIFQHVWELVPLVFELIYDGYLVSVVNYR